MTINQELIKDDLYHAVNGGWLEQAEIPADQASTGGFMDIHQEVEALLMGDVAAMAAGDKEAPAILGEFLKFYQMAMDIEGRNELGIQPAQHLIDRINAASNFQDIQDLTQDWTLQGLPYIFKLFISADMRNTDRYALYMDVPSLILPDTSMYSEDNPARVALLNIYEQMSLVVLKAFGYDERTAEDLVQSALALDEKMVPYQKSAEELADYTKMYNPRQIPEIKSYTPDYDFEGEITELIGEKVDKVIITQPAFFESFTKLFTPNNFKEIKAWLIVKLANHLTPYLSEDLRQLGSKYRLALSGNPETQSPTKHAYYLAYGLYDQGVGVYYGQNYFGPKARRDVEDMVATMINVFKTRLSDNQWLSQDTIEKAIKKLDKISVLVGYPDDVPEEYNLLIVQEQASFFDNYLHLTKVLQEYIFGKWNERVDRKKWGMGAGTVNAYYNPSSNLICFPAAILQAPFYSLEQSRSENYGGIGAVIAHEVTHAFDNNGAKFDAKGNLANWWQEEDLKEFEALADRVVQQWQGLETPSGPVNGKLTVSENIADAGGLIAAIEAAKLEDDTDLAELFMNWARIWRMKARPEYEQLLLTVDVHAPNLLRANMPVRNYQEFYDTFNITEGDRMFMPANERITIW